MDLQSTEMIAKKQEELWERLQAQETLEQAANEYKTAISTGDRETLVRILDEGRIRKKEVDG